jgi:hypothetical protein
MADFFQQKASEDERPEESYQNDQTIEKLLL